MLVFLFGLPLAITFLFNIAIGHPPQGVRVAMVSMETPHGVYDCVVPPPLDLGCNFTYPLSCRFAHALRANGLELVTDLCPISLGIRIAHFQKVTFLKTFFEIGKVVRWKRGP